VFRVRADVRDGNFFGEGAGVWRPNVLYFWSLGAIEADVERTGVSRPQRGGTARYHQPRWELYERPPRHVLELEYPRARARQLSAPHTPSTAPQLMRRCVSPKSSLTCLKTDWQTLWKVFFSFTDHFSGPDSAIGSLCVFVCLCSNFRIQWPLS